MHFPRCDRDLASRAPHLHRVPNQPRRAPISPSSVPHSEARPLLRRPLDHGEGVRLRVQHPLVERERRVADEG